MIISYGNDNKKIERIIKLISFSMDKNFIMSLNLRT